jgi:hypothetical protein
MVRDWHDWYTQYDDPDSSLSRRLEVVRAQLRRVLLERTGRTRLVSMCAGDGRDVLPVLAETGTDAEAVLVELDPALGLAAEAAASRLDLSRVAVRSDDAGRTDAYQGAVPADVLLACGVFGNISDDDVERTIRALPGLLAEGGVVIWTRGHRVPQDPTRIEGDPSEHVRELFARAGFDERTFVRPDDAGFRVGVHQLVEAPTGYTPGVELFTFV